MHSLDMLLEVVKTRPDLVFVCATVSRTHVGLRIGHADLVYTFPVAVEIVDSRKTLTSPFAT
jgi:hypothetical protein